MTGSATQRSRSETSTFRLRDFFTPLPSDVLVVFLAMHCRQPVRMAARRAAVVGTAVALAYSVKDEEGGLASLPDRISEKGSKLADKLHKLSTQAEHASGLNAVTRFGRSAMYGTLVALDYKVTLAMARMRSQEPDGEEYKATQSEVHLRSAKRLLHVCQTHQGCYIKFGQFIASLVRILPDEWTGTLRVLQDSNPGVPFKEVERLFREEFGVPWQQLFQSIEPTPLAAASLAQVHRAVTKEGEVVAVKCQYPRLYHQTESDIWTITQLAKLIGLLFKEYEYTWLLPEFQESIRLELDFHQEATNAERVSKLFANDRHVYVPSIRWDLSTSRVLTMEYINGVKVNNVQGLKEQGIDPVAVGTELSTLFSHMIFYFGFVHCDPHPGNLLIRKPPTPPNATWLQRTRHRIASALGRRPPFEVVVLDHGMYRRLREDVRRSYGSLWKAFMTRDVALGRESTQRLGLEPDMFEVLSIISVNRTPTSASSLGDTMSDKERAALREKYKDRQKYGVEKVRELLSNLPRDVLFILRTNALVRSINSELGAPTGSRFRIFGSSAVKGLSIPDDITTPEQSYFLSEIRDYVQRLPDGGFVLQKRTKAKILGRPQASVNQPTAAESFLFGGERLPRLRELRRQLLVADLRLRVWLIDGVMELGTWLLRWRDRRRASQLLGEQMLQEQLKVEVEETKGEEWRRG